MVGGKGFLSKTVKRTHCNESKVDTGNVYMKLMFSKVADLNKQGRRLRVRYFCNESVIFSGHTYYLC